MPASDRGTVVSAGGGPYHRLGAGPPEPHAPLGGHASGTPRPLAVIAQLSDLHLCDHQSPARIEVLDPFTHPTPWRPSLADLDVRTYRPQEAITAQVLDAMVRAVNGIGAGPVTGAAIDAVVLTGDLTDNAQANELDWLLGILTGTRVTPDSGLLGIHEGFGSPEWFSPAYWHPDGGAAGLPPDRPRSDLGFPEVPGLYAACLTAFDAQGCGPPWLLVYGNHDGLVQGTLTVSAATVDHATGTMKFDSLAEPVDEARVRRLLDGDTSAIDALATASVRPVTPDLSRRTLGRRDYVAAVASHGDHGFTAANAGTGTAYYRRDIGEVTLLAIDTVNEHGGWQGSIDEEQYDWLADRLAEADRERRPVVLASHHPLDDLVNTEGPDRRLLAGDVARLIGSHRAVIAWLNGHTHRSRIADRGGWWEFTAPSLVDWPQQGRLVEVAQVEGRRLLLASTMIDHSAEAAWDGSIDGPDALASLARELAANSWAAPQHDGVPETHPRRGRALDRNVTITLDNPFA